MTDHIAAELYAAQAASKAASANLARIRAQVKRRPDATVGEDFFTSLDAVLGTPGQEPSELRVNAGSSFLRISACADCYLIGGTDNGYDWARPQPGPPSSDATATVDVGGEQDALVNAGEVAHLLGHAMCTSFPYDRVEDGRDGHELLHDYVHNWINAHAQQAGRTPPEPTGSRTDADSSEPPVR